ncbi:dodecin domain-containing protein [Lysobacter sp. TY2-98]|uniref:dodecin family protein n=1 Tax=Lysobacter sp. TY2-98 TaxID=2290922 RepID=UPI000E20305B|nr:dodecin family protein [Lysobacter sp. TY2-98]AXK71050.1 dodecin domain-containing protein [Lysobacter sp. TY2-98]
MAVTKVIEINAASDQSIEDAVAQGLKRASDTLDGVQGAWVSDINVQTNERGEITEWRVRLRVSFLLR